MFAFGFFLVAVAIQAPGLDHEFAIDRLLVRHEICRTALLPFVECRRALTIVRTFQLRSPVPIHDRDVTLTQLHIGGLRAQNLREQFGTDTRLGNGRCAAGGLCRCTGTAICRRGISAVLGCILAIGAGRGMPAVRSATGAGGVLMSPVRHGLGRDRPRIAGTSITGTATVGTPTTTRQHQCQQRRPQQGFGCGCG